ncbi:MAG: DNA phosphorothioation-dependent restriction protein DptG [Clostridia bacterium]|nr:DNA phosphorothioation-dependent restriction protein DptG [Clostridia bacterium]
MIYTLSLDSFNNTFAVKEDGTKLTHRSGKRFKLFPFIANNNIEPVMDLSGLVGRYLSQIEQKEPVSITPEELIQKLKDDDETEIELGKEEIFEQVVRHMFFDREGKIRPINLRMLAQTPCEESNECRLADYLVDVLGDVDTLKRHMASASERVDAQSNALERFAASKLETIPSSRKTGNEYQRITNAVKKKFEEDFEYILGARNRTRDYLIPLLEFYYFSYTAQTALQLNRFLDGERSKCVPLFFCLEWEKTSQNRRCFSEGWNTLQDAVKRIFAHAITLEILNQTEEGTPPVDYISLQELTNCAPGEDHRIAEQIKVLTDAYRKAISDCPEMAELARKDSPDGEVAAEVRFLFESIRVQFENTVRNRPYSSYAEKFEEYSRKYLKRRGRSGMMLNLSEETLIFLTKICIKDQEKMRLNDVFAEFEARGVFLDNHSKTEIMHYYEKLNLIEKKSDSVVGQVDKDNMKVTGNSRFGCWICTMVKEDKSLKNFIDHGATELIPLRDFRNWLVELRANPDARDYRRRNGSVYLTSSGDFGRGPFTMEARKEILRRLLRLQVETGFELITLDELKMIDKLWEDEGDLSRRSLVEIYAEVTGEKLPWDNYRKAKYDEGTVALIHALCDKHDVPFDLMSKLMIAVDNSKFYTRSAVAAKNVERILNEGWLHFEAIREGLNHED